MFILLRYLDTIDFNLHIGNAGIVSSVKTVNTKVAFFGNIFPWYTIVIWIPSSIERKITVLLHFFLTSSKIIEVNIEAKFIPFHNEMKVAGIGAVTILTDP